MGEDERLMREDKADTLKSATVTTSRLAKLHAPPFRAAGEIWLSEYGGWLMKSLGASLQSLSFTSRQWEAIRCLQPRREHQRQVSLERNWSQGNKAEAAGDLSEHQDTAELVLLTWKACRDGVQSHRIARDDLQGKIM